MIFFIIKQALNHLYSDNYIVFKKKLVRLPWFFSPDSNEKQNSVKNFSFVRFQEPPSEVP